MCQTSSILINIISKSIGKNIVYLSFRYDTSISFMIPLQYDTFDMVNIPTSGVFSQEKTTPDYPYKSHDHDHQRADLVIA